MPINNNINKQFKILIIKMKLLLYEFQKYTISNKIIMISINNQENINKRITKYRILLTRTDDANGI